MAGNPLFEVRSRPGPAITTFRRETAKPTTAPIPASVRKPISLAAPVLKAAAATSALTNQTRRLWRLRRSADRVCGLADHIRSANTNTSVGGCPKGTNHDVISISDDIVLRAPLPPITGTITIEGNGHSISGNYKQRIFQVDGGRLTINNLTLTRGNSTESGGAIYASSGARIRINDSALRENKALRGGAIALDYGASSLIINNSQFISNSGFHAAGAVFLRGGDVTIAGSSFLRNSGRYSGGALEVASSSGALTVSNSSFITNSAMDGGAISVYGNGHRTTMTHVTMYDNRNVATEVTKIGDRRTLEGAAIWINDNYRYFNLYNSVIAGPAPRGQCVGA